MDRFIEFAVNHWVLITLFFALLLALLVTESRRGGRTVSSQQLTHLANHEGAAIIDVRETVDYQAGHITGSINVPYTRLKDNIVEIEQYKEQPVVLVCKVGQHSGEAGRALNSQGFVDVRRLSGGIAGWKADGLPLIKASYTNCQ